MRQNYSDTSFRGIKHKVPARNEPRLLVRVNVIPQNGCDIGGQHVKQGEHDVIIYSTDLPEVMALVRTDKAKADFARAKQVFANKIAALVRGLGDSVHDNQERERRLAEFGESPYSILAEDPAYTGGFGKLESCVTLEDVPAPPTLENIQTRQFGDLTEAIREALGGQRLPSKDDIAEFIRLEIEKGVAAALEAATKPFSKK